MNEEFQEEVGYLKLSGGAVPKGIVDAAAAGSALIGLDEAIRFFNESQSPGFAKLEYQIPVRTTSGSWVAWILAATGAGGAAFALGYLKKAGEKMAEADFDGVGFKDVLSKSVDAIQHLIKLIKHTKRNKDWDAEHVVWRNDNTEVGIRNSNDEVLYLPYEFFRWFMNLPPSLIARLTTAIASERTLAIGVRRGSDYEEVSVSIDEKRYFSGEIEIELDEILFPELMHGEGVRLEGKLTRGNESSNSVGFEYQGHILNCVPEEGSIRRFKPALFLHCVVDATVSRLSKNKMVAERRPTLIVRRITPLESDDTPDLFRG